MVVRVRGDELGLFIVASVDDAVAGDGHVRLGADLFQLSILYQCLEQQGEGIVLAVDGFVDVLLLDDSLASSRIFQLSWRRCKSADLRLRDLARRCSFVGQIDRYLDGAGAGVDGEDDLHGEQFVGESEMDGGGEASASLGATTIW